MFSKCRGFARARPTPPQSQCGSLRGVATVALDSSVARPAEDSGAPPLVILHGLFGSKRNWSSLAKQFARDLARPVWTVDLRNHGDSPHQEPHTYGAMAADVVRFVRDHNFGRAVVLGHSMGAKVAMTVALQNPELVSSGIFVDNAPVDAQLSSEFGTYLKAMKEIDRARFTKRSEADALLAKYEDNLGVRQFLLTNLTYDAEKKCLQNRMPLDTFSKSLSYVADFPQELVGRRYEGPVLVVRGTKSLYVPDEVIPAIGTYFPRFRMVDFPTGHWVHSEMPNEFRSAVVDFVEQAEGGE